ncbi:uncharacterized protein K452DRAFT_279988 [Aplosporella prunicola CBS 121167]|uniref:Rhodopsin domain-containing protein n=1 Tax=Aplosporella prunicola CBS 121167 TaxID=1176127 RepID=A0A6A6AZP8_9PEZI|nr:uncharacterized protein K452DRAFT_279988 [Aplosporella prunicola CBS 121167]KAF2136435.1 hypothetical protein K452DRAFT_279988 [Aplosporella prunicola CBS 121167]
MSAHTGVSSTVPQPAKVHEHVFMGVLWGGFAAGTVFSGLRFLMRFKTFRRFYLDDALVLSAWLITLVIAVIWQVVADDMYLDNRVASGRQYPPADFIPRVERFLKSSAAIVFLFYTTLWTIKLSFLFFFRRLYMNMGKLVGVWWGILTFTIAAWACCVGTIDYNCLVDDLVNIADHCSGLKEIKFQRDTLIANCVLDVATDLAITSIPISMLWKVRVSGRRKAGLAAVFCVTIITMVFAIVRVAVISSLTVQPDMSWLYMWSNIEIFAALIVACLGSFRSLFHSQHSAKRASSEPETATAEARRTRPKRPFMRNFTSLFTATDSNESSTENDTLQGIIAMYGSENRESKSVHTEDINRG